MAELTRFNWQAFNIPATVKISVGLLIMLVLAETTGQPWLATALAAMFAWMANAPGPLPERVKGMLAFAVCAALLTLVYGLIELSIAANVLVIALIGFLGTAVLTLGMRSFMVGFSVICWAIYGPLMVATTSVQNCLLAVLVGTAIVVLLNVVGDLLFKPEPVEDVGSSAPGDAGPDKGFVLAYAVTVAAVLALNMYFGWTQLKTDPSLMLGGAFFVIGFELDKTWVMGIARALGLVAGVLVGLSLAQLIGPGLLLTVVMILACGLSFGASGVHPGAWMFFFMIFVAIGWFGLDPEAFRQSVAERFYGELFGIASAMVAIVFLDWWQRRRPA